MPNAFAYEAEPVTADDAVWWTFRHYATGALCSIKNPRLGLDEDLCRDLEHDGMGIVDELDGEPLWFRAMTDAESDDYGDALRDAVLDILMEA